MNIPYEISKILLEILNVLLIVYFFLPLSTLKGIIMSEKNDEVSESYESFGRLLLRSTSVSVNTTIRWRLLCLYKDISVIILHSIVVIYD